MRPGISTACFYPTPTEHAVKSVLKTELKTVEIFVNAQHEYSDAYIFEQKNIFDANGVQIYSFHPFTSFAEPLVFFSGYQRRMEEGIEYYKYQFHQAAKYGAKVFNFHGDNLHSNCEPERYCEIYYKLYCEAKKEGIIFSQENVSRCKSARPEFLKEMSRLLNNDVCFTLDIKQANRIGYSPYAILEEMKGKIVNFHISDFDQEHNCLLPYAGTFDLDTFFGEVRKSGYAGPAILEVYSDNYVNEHQVLECTQKMHQKIF